MAKKNNIPKWLPVMFIISGVFSALNGLMSLLRSPDMYDILYVVIGLVMVFSGVVASRK